MGYSVEASLVWGIPADEVPQEWLDKNGFEDVGEVWVHKGREIFTCHTQGSDCDPSNYVGYVIACAELSYADEIDNVGEIEQAIKQLDPTPFNEMAEYAMVRPRLFLICSWL